LVQAWGDHVIGRLRPKAKALFQAGRFVGVDGERAVFGLPNETHRSRCEEVRGEIEAALAEQFGRPIGLELVVDPGAEPPRSRSASPEEPSRPMAAAAPTGTGSGNGREPQGADLAGSTGPAGPVPPPTGDRAREAEAPHPGDDLDVLDDPADFDESELGELVDVDNSAEARVRLAFPGAEEVG
jgi:DNA polymerase-3 subunit gamma/tau